MENRPLDSSYNVEARIGSTKRWCIGTAADAESAPHGRGGPEHRRQPQEGVAPDEPSRPVCHSASRSVGHEYLGIAVIFGKATDIGHVRGGRFRTQIARSMRQSGSPLRVPSPPPMADEALVPARQADLRESLRRVEGRPDLDRPVLGLVRGAELRDGPVLFVDFSFPPAPSTSSSAAFSTALASL